MVSCKTLSVIACIAILGVMFIPQEVTAGGGGKRYLIAYLLAKSLKPRIVPIPLPLPFPIKFSKKSHATYPVHSHSQSAHAELVHGHGHGGFEHFGGGHGGY